MATFCEMVDEAIADEKTGADFYRKMIWAPFNRDKFNLAYTIIDSIEKDEEKHAGMLEIIKKDVCGLK